MTFVGEGKNATGEVLENLDFGYDSWVQGEGEIRWVLWLDGEFWLKLRWEVVVCLFQGCF